MAETTTVPGLGPVPKKELTIGLVVVGVLVVVYYVRKPKASATPAAAAGTVTGDQFPADGTVGNPSDPYSTDAASGITYGNESGTGTFSTFGTGTGNVPAPTGTVANGPPFSTNAQWSNWVIAQMTANNPQQDPAALTDAIGLYLAGQPVSPAQKTLIFDARAIGGDPPVAGPNNYPPNVQTNGSTGGGSMGGGSTGGTSTWTPPHVIGSGPDVIGKTLAQATAIIDAAGFHVNTKSGNLAGHVVSSTAYSDMSVNLGLS